MAKHAKTPAHNSITTDSTGVVVCVMRGFQTAAAIRRAVGDMKRQLEEQRAQGKKALLLVDIQTLHITDSDTEGRAESKRVAGSLDFDACAIIGRQRLAAVITYMMRSLQHRQIRFFTHERQARAWLADTNRHRRHALRRTSRLTWLFIVTVILVQAATILVWHQASERNRIESQSALESRAKEMQDATDLRLQAYIDALRGFQGLFRASDFVSKQDFENYYKELSLEEHYPGLRSLAFISAVNEQDLPAFVATMRSRGLTGAGGKPFEILSKTTYPRHHILTYIAATNSTNIGLDVGSVANRQQLYDEALASGTVFTSGLVNFRATADQPAQSGFFITVPAILATNSKGQPDGLVNAVFNYKDFFTQLFQNQNILDDLAVSFVDVETGATIYESNKAKGDTPQELTANIPVANRSWKLVVRVGENFGISQAQARSPVSVLVLGQILSVFLITVFWLQFRARRQALDLAEAITQDLRRERNLAVANDQKSSAILSSIGDAVFAIDTKGRIQLFNPAAQQVSGITVAEALGKPYKTILNFVFEKSGRSNDHFISAALEGHLTTMGASTELIRRDGKRVPVADSAAAIRDGHNKIIGAIVVFRDVSKERELDKAKSEFVSLASHQLRTPLSAINWYGEMLLGGDAGKLNKAQHEYISEIFHGSQRMVDLVNSLLNVSRLELGKMPSKPVPTDLNELIDSLEKELATTITRKHLNFTKHTKKLPPITADPKQMRMIVQNLLSNAVKYTPAKGAITVTLRRATEADRKAGGLTTKAPLGFFSVKDTGYGIPKAQQDKIFEKMFRADNVHKLDVEGTGLGLYIVKQVVEKNGGKVWFESTESVGTTFFVLLPFGATGRKK